MLHVYRKLNAEWLTAGPHHRHESATELAARTRDPALLPELDEAAGGHGGAEAPTEMTSDAPPPDDASPEA